MIRTFVLLGLLSGLIGGCAGGSPVSVALMTQEKVQLLPEEKLCRYYYASSGAKKIKAEIDRRAKRNSSQYQNSGLTAVKFLCRKYDLSDTKKDMSKIEAVFKGVLNALSAAVKARETTEKEKQDYPHEQ